MASMFTAAIQQHVMSFILARLPLHPVDIPQQSSFAFNGDSGLSLHLTDIALDIDRLQTQYLPLSMPFNVRHAFASDLKIQINTNGIKITVDGIDCIVNPKTSFGKSEFANSASSIFMNGIDDPVEGLGEMMESVVGFVDAMSGVNSLCPDAPNTTNSQPWSDEIDDADDQDHHADGRNSHLSGEKNKSRNKKGNEAALSEAILNNDLDVNTDLDSALKRGSNRTKSPNNLILKYAVEYILNKTSVLLTNIKFKIISDPISMMLTVALIEACGDNSKRRCTIENIEVSGLGHQKGKTTFNSSHGNKKEYHVDDNQTNNDVDAESENTNGYKTDNVSGSEGGDDEYDEHLMSSSFMVEHREEMEQSLMESAIYSTSGKSVYLSAIEGDFKPSPVEVDRTKEDDKDILVNIDRIKISLEDRTKLSIEIGIIKVSLNPFPRVISSFIELLSHMDKQKCFSKTQQNAAPNEKTSLNANSKLTLSLFSIELIQVGLQSKLNKSNNFEDKTPFICQFSKFLLQQRSSTLVQGSLEEMELFFDDQKVTYFERTSSSHADIRIETQTLEKEHITTIIFSHSLHIKVDYALLETLIGLKNEFQPIWHQIQQFKAKSMKKNNTEGPMSWRTPNPRTGFGLGNPNSTRRQNKPFYFVFKAGKTEGIISLSDDGKETLSFSIAPFLYDDINRISTLEFINLELSTILGTAKLNLQDIRVTLPTEPTSFRTYDVNTQSVIKCYTKKTMAIDSITFNSPWKTLFQSLQILKGLKEKFSHYDKNNDPGVSFSGTPSTQRNRMMQSIMLKRRIIDIYLLIKNFDVKISSINEEFGDIVGTTRNISFITSSLDHQISVPEFSICRLYAENVEKIVEKPNKWSSSPMLFIKVQHAINIYINNWLINYNGRWLEMFSSGENVVDTSVTHIKAESIEQVKRKLMIEIFVSLTDVSIGLKPVDLDSCAVLVLNKSNLDIYKYTDSSLIFQLSSNLISLFLIDDTKGNEKAPGNIIDSDDPWKIASIWTSKGYVNIGTLSTISLKIALNSKTSLKTHFDHSPIDIQANLEKITLDLCSDSTQCFIQLLKNIKKPVYFSYDDKYKDKNELIDVFHDIDLDYFDSSKQVLSTLPQLERAISNLSQNGGDSADLSSSQSLEIVEDYVGNMNNKLRQKEQEAGSSGDAHYSIPVKVHFSVSQINLNLHDGYDWKETRFQIKNALERVSKTASELNKIGVSDSNVEEGFNIEETLYKSVLVEAGPENDNNGAINEYINTIYLGKKADGTPKLLTRSLKNKVQIMLEDIDVDFKLLSTNEPHPDVKPDFYSGKEGDFEVVNEIGLSIDKFTIFDNVPTSSWNMFAGYMREYGEREVGKSMVKVNIELVRPIKELAAIEMRLRVQVLPLRFYVDQDTLEFLTRFLEFKDKRFIPPAVDDEEMFIQRLIIDTVKLKLDYKPKKIDYADIRTGHTGEFVNIFILDGSEITLNEVKLYGINGMSNLNSILTSYWSPDIKRNQLVGVLSGLAPVRSIINVSAGMNKIVSVPVREYRKDGRVIRSLQIGALAFTKATSGEILKLGAKLAAGTQTILENTEQMLGGAGSSMRVVNEGQAADSRESHERRRSSAASFGDEDENDYHRYFFQNKNIINSGDRKLDVHSEECAITDEDGDSDEGNSHEGIDKESSYIKSLYSNQPSNFNEGLKVAYGSIQRNLKIARNAVYEAKSKANEAETTSGVIKEYAKVTPVVLIRPAIAATEALSKGLLGGVNEINPEEKQRAEEKYKKVEEED